MQDPAAFLLVAAGAATDLAMRQKSKFAPDAFEYRAKAMKMVNRRMMIPRQSISDGAITCCVVLAGLEVCSFSSGSCLDIMQVIANSSH